MGLNPNTSALLSNSKEHVGNKCDSEGAILDPKLISKMLPEARLISPRDLRGPPSDPSGDPSGPRNVPKAIILQLSIIRPPILDAAAAILGH